MRPCTSLMISLRRSSSIRFRSEYRPSFMEAFCLPVVVFIIRLLPPLSQMRSLNATVVFGLLQTECLRLREALCKVCGIRVGKKRLGWEKDGTRLTIYGLQLPRFPTSISLITCDLPA